MFKLIFGVLLGAVAMYFLDPREGPSRRQQVKDRVQELQHRGNGTATFEDAYEAAHSSAHRATSAFGSAMESAADEARSEAGQARRSSSRIAESTPDESESSPSA
jgi:hypothetical protein